jgi:Flp pilus assembly protein TadB
VFLAGFLAALLLVATEFTTVASVEVAGNSCEVISDAEPELAERCQLNGFERNGGAFLLLAVLAAVMAWGAGIGGSRPAAAALCVVGVLVLAWALLVDLPVTRETGAIGRTFEGASGSAGPGLWLELAAGVLALGAGVIRLFSGDVD